MDDGTVTADESMGPDQPGFATSSRLLAIEVLLADPDALLDDVLESCLYVLRDKLTATEDAA
jgi:hypothetical protein